MCFFFPTINKGKKYVKKKTGKDYKTLVSRSENLEQLFL